MIILSIILGILAGIVLGVILMSEKPSRKKKDEWFCRENPWLNGGNG